LDEDDALIDSSKSENADEQDFVRMIPGKPQGRGRAAGARGRQDHVFVDHAFAGKVDLRRGDIFRGR
jgi:hypothetical protein